MTGTIAASFPATGAEMAVSITQSATHQRLGIELGFDGMLDAPRLARAVRLSLDAQPILGCALRLTGRTLLWERRNDLDQVNPFALMSSNDPEEDMEAFQAEEVADEGPQVAVRLLRAGAGDRLGIKLSHVLVDGQAAKQYAYLLADLYTKLGEDPALSVEPDPRPRPTALDVWAALDPEQRRAAKAAKSWAMPTWEVEGQGRSGRDIRYLSTSIEPERFVRLKAYGAKRGGTVNDMLLTAFFRACVQEFDPASGRPLSLMCTADLRRFLPHPQDVPIGGLSISGSLDIERVDSESFDQTLQRVRERMDAWAAACYGAAPAMNAEKLARLGYPAVKGLLGMMLRMGGGRKTYPWFTNIGTLDEALLDFDGLCPLNGSMFGPVARGVSLVPVISTYAQRLTIRMGLCQSDYSPRVVARLLDLTSKELPV